MPLRILNLNLRLSRLSAVPRNHGHNTVLDIDFDIELGNTADEAKDDPGKRKTPGRGRLAAALLTADGELRTTTGSSM